MTVLAVSVERNRAALLALLERGARIRSFDHHAAGEVPSHPGLEAHIDESAGVCTSILVDRHLKGRFRRWAVVAAFGDDPFVSMNVWVFGPGIFRACREVPPSARGEYEIPLPVRWAIAHHGMRARPLRFHTPGLDLSRRGDIALVTERLRGIAVRL